MKVFWPNFKRTVDGIQGLVVVVVKDAYTTRNLMVAFANEDAVRRTLETGRATFFTTSRGRLWTKGEESGNFMKVLGINIDCDGDAVEYLVEPQGDGLACHTLARSCFYRNMLQPAGAEVPPKAGKAEELQLVEASVHPELKNRH